MTPEQYMTLAGWMLTGSLGLGLFAHNKLQIRKLLKLNNYAYEIAIQDGEYISKVSDHCIALTEKVTAHEASLCEFKEEILTRIPERMKKLDEEIAHVSGQEYDNLQEQITSLKSELERRNNLLIEIGARLGKHETNIEALRKLHFVREGFPLLSVATIYNEAERRNNIVTSHSQAIANLEKAIQKKPISPVKPAISASKRKVANGRSSSARS